VAEDTPRLQFGTRAPAVRRAVGPTAWVVLEELVLASNDDDAGGRRARASVRSLARELGLAKDTIAGALRRLTEAGLVRRDDQRRAGSGVFVPGSYVLDGVALANVLELDPARARRGSTPARECGIQASLFDGGVSA